MPVEPNFLLPRSSQPELDGADGGQPASTSVWPLLSVALACGVVIGMGWWLRQRREALPSTKNELGVEAGTPSAIEEHLSALLP